jgi:hypothetical protein
MSLKPQNIVQAAEADLARHARNIKRHKLGDTSGMEQFAFHRKHVRRAGSARDLITLALMDPAVAASSIKRNTVLIYSSAGLLVRAARLSHGTGNDE